MISGKEYNSICNWHVCPRYPQNFDSNLSENDKVFLNLDYFEYFLNFITHNKPANKFILITQNSDRDFTDEMVNLISPFVNKIYAINATCNSSIVKKIPLGFNDDSLNHINKIESQDKKDNLIYCNFKLHHHADRPICFDYFKQFDWVDVEYSTIQNNPIPVVDFYNKLKTYKYCVSPRGTGIDTHRIYESLYFGVIPIVTKNELADLYKDMPVLLIDNWGDITEDVLNSSYESLHNKLIDWINNNNWYKTKFWINE